MKQNKNNMSKDRRDRAATTYATIMLASCSLAAYFFTLERHLLLTRESLWKK